MMLEKLRQLFDLKRWRMGVLAALALAVLAQAEPFQTLVFGGTFTAIYFVIAFILKEPTTR